MSDAANTKAGSENKKNKMTIIIIAVLAVVVIALVGVVAYLLGRGDADSGKQANGNEGTGSESKQSETTQRQVAGSVRTVVDESSADDIMSQMREEVAEGMFECKMSMTWTFKDGKSESGDAYVANSVNNSHPIYFDVYKKDTEELLYSSPVLPVGTDLKNIKLDKELPKGDYKATVMYTLIKDVESQEEISSAGFVITIKVKN
jgi:hypothetical protein